MPHRTGSDEGDGGDDGDDDDDLLRILYTKAHKVFNIKMLIERL